MLLLALKMEQGEHLNRAGCAGQKVSRENEGIQQKSNLSQEAWPGTAGHRAGRETGRRNKLYEIHVCSDGVNIIQLKGGLPLTLELLCSSFLTKKVT